MSKLLALLSRIFNLSPVQRTVPFFMKEGVAGKARRGNCEKIFFHGWRGLLSVIACLFLFPAMVNAANLPAGYTELEYIESTGTQYINTLVPVNDNNSFLITYRARSSGYLVSQGNNALRFSPATNVTWYSKNYHFSKNSDTSGFHTAEFGFNYFTLDGVAVESTADHDSASGTSVYLFAFNGATPSNIISAQVKQFKIWDDNGTLVRNFIPAKNSSNTVGLYDTVNNRFYENQGTGTFTAGPDVASSCENSGAITSVIVYGATEQTGTPTPSAPAAITTNNGVLKVSPNLFDFNSITSSTVTIPVETGKTYTWSFDKANYDFRWDSSAVWGIDSNGNVVTGGVALYPSGTAYDPTSYFSITVNSPNIVGVRTTFRGGTMPATVENIKASKMMFQLGTRRTTYHPYGEIYVEGTTQTLADSANHTATVANLLAVGDYKDEQNINTGAITRKVGVKVLDGTEDWRWQQYLNNYFTITTAQSDMLKSSSSELPGYSNMFSVVDSASGVADNTVRLVYSRFSIRYDAANGDVNAFKQYLADQYAAGTPVMIVYPLATSTNESVTAQSLTTAPVRQTAGSISGMTIKTILQSGCEFILSGNPLKIATTKYNTTAFSGVVTALNTAIDKIKDVVSNTIAQTTAVANLQSGKQRRPDESCPNGKICLLVEDQAGTPHWYEIIERAPGIVPAGSGYTQVEYLQSDGNSYIDTGITPIANVLRVSGKYQNVASAAGGTPFGAVANPAPRNGFRTFSNADTGAVAIQSGSADTTVSLSNYNDMVDFDLTVDDVANTITGQVNSTTVNVTNSGVNLNFNQNMLLFRGRLGSDSIMSGQFKIWSLMVEKEGVLVRDFVPARRDSDGVLGMYDTVSGNFFTNAGSGKFYAPDQYVPNTYTRLEYIESTGTQWIDTGVIPNQDYRFQVKTKFSSLTSGTIIGARASASTHMFAIASTGTPPDRVYFNGGYGTWGGTTTNPTDTDIHTLDLNKNVFSIDGIVNKTFTATTVTPGQNAYLFVMDTGGAVGSGTYFSGRLYSAQIWNNGTPVRDMVPVRRNSDNELGMYDCVNGVFYDNDGSGSFSGPAAQ